MDDDAIDRAVRGSSRSAASIVVAVAAGALTWAAFALVTGVAWLLQRPGVEYYRQSELPTYLWRFTMTGGLVIAIGVAVAVGLLSQRRGSA